MNFIITLLTLQLQLRIYHWQTENYSQHKAFGKTYENLDSLIDSFMEEFMGKYGKVRSNETINISVKNIDELQPVQFIENIIKFLTSELQSVVKEEDTNLLNIRDSILSELQELKYLLQLK
jgi:DNA-binding ferritin-like protein